MGDAEEGKHSVGIAPQYASALSNGQLPDTGVNDACAGRGSGDVAPFPPREQDK
jgi:hypothetical protein